MSLNTISDAQNQPPPAKKGKTNNGEAAPPDQTAVAAVVAPTINNANDFAAIVDARLKELEKNFVSKEDLEKNFVSKEDLEKNFVSKEEHEKTKGELGLLKARFDHSTVALAPATQHALFETAIYTFVSKVIPSSVVLQTDKINYAVSLVCRKVLTSFLECNEEAGAPTFSWQGPKDMDKSGVLLHGLVGLVAFIQSQEHFDLLMWDPKDRNDFSHNGKFLDSYYSTPPPTKQHSSEPSFSAKKLDVKKKRKDYTDKASSGVNIPVTVAEAVSRVVAALKEKLISVDNNFVDEIVKGLNKLATGTKEKGKKMN